MKLVLGCAYRELQMDRCDSNAHLVASLLEPLIFNRASLANSVCANNICLIPCLAALLTKVDHAQVRHHV